MSTYSINDYKLKLANGFQQLELIDKSTQSVEQTYSLGSGYKVSVSGDNYVIDSGSCDECHSEQFNSAENDTLTFDNSKMIGVTIVRIECKQKEFSYFLDECPVYLKYESSELVVNSPADTSGTGPCPECLDLEVTDLFPCPQV